MRKVGAEQLGQPRDRGARQRVDIFERRREGLTNGHIRRHRMSGAGAPAGAAKMVKKLEAAERAALLPSLPEWTLDAARDGLARRSEESRVGKERVSASRYRGATAHSKKKDNKNRQNERHY